MDEHVPLFSATVTSCKTGSKRKVRCGSQSHVARTHSHTKRARASHKFIKDAFFFCSVLTTISGQLEDSSV